MHFKKNIYSKSTSTESSHSGELVWYSISLSRPITKKPYDKSRNYTSINEVNIAISTHRMDVRYANKLNSRCDSDSSSSRTTQHRSQVRTERSKTTNAVEPRMPAKIDWITATRVTPTHVNNVHRGECLMVYG